MMPAIEESSEQGNLTQDEAKGLMEMYKSLLNAYGQFAETLGKIQQSHTEAYLSMFSLEAMAKLPELLSDMSEKKPELGKLLTRIFIKIATSLPRLGNMMNLSAKEKIQLGHSLKAIGKDFDELLNWVDRGKDQ